MTRFVLQLAMVVVNLVPTVQLLGQQSRDPAPDVSYAQVAKIFKTYCAGCHNDGEREGDFSVGSFQQVLAGTPDGPVVKPGMVEESRLVQMLRGQLDPAMPPEEEPQPSDDELALIEAWVLQGATGPLPIETGLHDRAAPSLPAADKRFQFTGAACAIGGGFCAFGSFQRVDVIDVAQDRIGWSIDGLSGKINSLRTSADHQQLVVGSGIAGVSGEALLIDAADGAIIRRFAGHNDAIYCAALSPDGRLLATGSYDRKVIIWDVASGAQMRELSGHNGAIYDLDFDPTGQVLATASADQTVKLWQVATGTRLDTLGQPEGEQRCVRFSPDGSSLFAAGGDRQIRKWKLVASDRPAINPLLEAKYAHESEIVRLEFVNRELLATASSDCIAKLWTSDSLSQMGESISCSDLPVGICVWDDELSPTASPVTPQPSSTRVDSSQAGSISVMVVALDGQQLWMDLNAPRPLPDDPSESTRLLAVNSHETWKWQQAPFHTFQETEPNNRLGNEQVVELPATISGVIEQADEPSGCQDLFRFAARQGEPWIVEVIAAREKSPLDSRIEILDALGNSVLRTRLQAVRASYFTFRGKNSSISDDFRLHKWEDMQLDEFLYANGEVNRLWLYPRGPDSGFKVYPGSGDRYSFFDTTPIAHALGEPAYIVRELAPEEPELLNGLPVFPIYFENDDDARREHGKDSKLSFVPPHDGEYLLRICDARGFGGSDYRYQVAIRPPQPDFELSIVGAEMKMPLGSGREWSVSARRMDGLDGPIVVELGGLPPGVLATNPLTIEANQNTASGCIFLPEGFSLAQPQGEGDSFEITLTATAEVRGIELRKELPQRIKVTLSAKPELQLRLVDARNSNAPLQELSLRPGETVSARVIVERHGVDSRISLGKEDSGRNLPHGAFVDNIGLNGLLITEEQSEREFFITAAPKVLPGRRQFHLRSDTAGNPTSPPVWLNVLPPSAVQELTQLR
jgi:mono/diheme cytochrome c family protein